MAAKVGKLRMDDRSAKRTTPSEFINQVKAEADKVVWPSRQETVTTAIFVALLMVVLALFFLGVDSVFGALVKWLLSLA